MSEGKARRWERHVGRFVVRQAGQEDASLVAAALRDGGPAVEALPASEVERLVQTGQRFLVVEGDGEVCGSVRDREEEGIAWFDLLVANVAGAGRALVRAVEMDAQERGLRLVRCRAPEERLGDYFGWLGYFPVSREDVDGEAMLVLERRLPLLTVREQRREDAAFIGELTGRDTYALELGARPGWFVAADGDRPVGVTWVADGGGGEAELATPVLVDGYRGRGLEVWMLERAAYHAQHGGYHRARVAGDRWLGAQGRDLEDRGWFPDGDGYVRRLAGGGHEEMDDGL